MNVFVYGTLKRGYGNHKLLGSSPFIGQGSIKGFDIYDLGPYPAIQESEDPSAVVWGEVYEINDAVLKALDQLEGEGFLYKRSVVTVDMNGAAVEAYVYVYLRKLTMARKLANEWRPMRC